MATISGTSGDDSLDGTAGDDTITGEAGRDTILAGEGGDSVDAGTGDDSIWAGGGNDTVLGGDGADTIEGEAGDDSLLGGAGGDSIHGADGADHIDGGDDNDTLYGDAGDDFIAGGGGDDLIYDSGYASGGANTISGGDGNDTIYGGTEQDTISGGGGDDVIHGGTGADVFVISANSGLDTIEDYNAGDGDMINIDYPGITDYAGLAPYLSDDGNWGTLISLPDGSVTQVKWLNYSTVSAANFTFDAAPVCLKKGTRIATARGPVAVERLRPGDRIVTRADGFVPLRLLLRTSYRFKPGPHRMKPVRIRAGALGAGRPVRELLVSPQHRIAVPQDAPDHLVAAKKLLGWPGVSERPGCRLVHYYHLLLDRHSLIEADGVWVETLLLTRYSEKLSRVPPQLRGMSRRPALPIRREAPPIAPRDCPMERPHAALLPLAQ